MTPLGLKLPSRISYDPEEVMAQVRRREEEDIARCARAYDEWEIRRKAREFGLPIDPMPCDKRLSDEVLDAVSNGSNVYLWGPAGRGKTAAAQDALRSYGSGVFVRDTDLRNSLRSTFGGDGVWDDKLERYRSAKLLVLDDMGKAAEGGDFAAWYGTAIYGLLDDRWSSLAPTVVTSQLDPTELVRKVAQPDVVEALYSRLMGNCRTIRLGGHDRRKKEV